MRAALRQAPNVIAVGELKERETTELALDAAEAGHLVLSTFTAPTAPKSIERLVASFSGAEQAAVRDRLARILRFVVCQRLIPSKKEGERVAVFEVVRAESPTLSLQSSEGRTPDRRVKARTLDAEIERLVRESVISTEAALAYALDPPALAKKLNT